MLVLQSAHFHAPTLQPSAGLRQFEPTKLDKNHRIYKLYNQHPVQSQVVLDPNAITVVKDQEVLFESEQMHVNENAPPTFRTSKFPAQTPRHGQRVITRNLAPNFATISAVLPAKRAGSPTNTV